MKTYNELIKTVENIMEIDNQLKAKGQKTTAALQRKAIHAVQKLAVQAKKDLIAATKEDLMRVGF